MKVAPRGTVGTTARGAKAGLGSRGGIQKQSQEEYEDYGYEQYDEPVIGKGGGAKGYDLS